MFCVVGLLAVLRLFPSLASVEDHLPPALESGNGGFRHGSLGALRAGAERGDCAVVCAGVVMTTVRSFVVAGLEAATAVILESVYGWSQVSIGLAVGSTFLCCLPLRFLHWGWEASLSLTGWIRMTAAASVLGSLLISGAPWWLTGPHGGAGSLLLGDVLLFPTLCLADSLVRGLQFQHLRPEGSVFDLNNTALWNAIGSGGVGRTLGPWFARWCIQEGGRPRYACMQLAAVCIFIAFFEGVMASRTRSAKDAMTQ